MISISDSNRINWYFSEITEYSREILYKSFKRILYKSSKKILYESSKRILRKSCSEFLLAAWSECCSGTTFESHQSLSIERPWECLPQSLLDWIAKSIDSLIDRYSSFDSESIHQLHLHNLSWSFFWPWSKSLMELY